MSEKLTFSMVVNHTNAVLQAMQAIAPPGKDISAVTGRWAFLVTYAELSDVIDEMMQIPEIAEAITPEQAQDIRDGKAMMNLPNGMKILPELIPNLDG